MSTIANHSVVAPDTTFETIWPPVPGPTERQRSFDIDAKFWNVKDWSPEFRDIYGDLESVTTYGHWRELMDYPVRREILPVMHKNFWQLQQQVGFLKYCTEVDLKCRFFSAQQQVGRFEMEAAWCQLLARRLAQFITNENNIIRGFVGTSLGGMLLKTREDAEKEMKRRLPLAIIDMMSADAFSYWYQKKLVFPNLDTSFQGLTIEKFDSDLDLDSDLDFVAEWKVEMIRHSAQRDGRDPETAEADCREETRDCLIGDEYEVYRKADRLEYDGIDEDELDSETADYDDDDDEQNDDDNDWNGESFEDEMDCGLD